MEGSLLDREPSPDRILNDAGAGCAIVAVGGSVYHFINSLRNSPSGARIPFSMQAVSMNAPRLAGSFAAWGTLYSVCDCEMVYARQREDPYNSILAGATTGAILNVRQGFRTAAWQSLMGAGILALISGLGLMANRISVTNPGSMQVDDTSIPHQETSSGVGGEKVEEGATSSSSSSKTEFFDEPSMPIPSFLA